jgi:hypothetical protein
MMTKKLKKLLVAGLVLASTSYASSNNNNYYSKSLVGIEGGYSYFSVDDTTATEKTEDFGLVGMKIGAETHNVRMFLSVRNAFMSSDDYDYKAAYMYGAELQYLFNISEMANFYIGGNIGKFNLEFDDLLSNKREFSTKYMGGDAGFNIHIGDSLDLELGGRIMTLDDSEHTLNTVKYTFDDIITGYMSLIFKYQMD